MPFQASDYPCVGATVTPSTVPAGDEVTVTLELNHFDLEAPMGQPTELGHGHYHIYLDDATGRNYLTSDEQLEVSFDIPRDTEPGPHTLRVSLGENNHAPLSPAAQDILDIVVE